MINEDNDIGFHDEDEELTDDDIEEIYGELERLGWGEDKIHRKEIIKRLSDKYSRELITDLFTVLEISDDDIRQPLQKRRQNGGCSMWRSVGLKWMFDNGYYDELLDWEKEFVVDNVWEKE